METKPKRGRRKINDIPTVDNLILTKRKPMDCEQYLETIMLDPEVGVDRRDSAAKALLRFKMQRESQGKIAGGKNIGRKEALAAAADMLTSKGNGGSWSKILN